MARKLKTYQTSLGFFDQAIAAPSMKAALEAWGADSNLFHQGAAKESSDPDVIAATMAKPGVVLKRPVGSNGPFREHAVLPSHLAGEDRQTTTPAPAKSKSRRSEPHPKQAERTERTAADRQAALAFEKEQKRRERERAKEEAARHKERERRQQAVARAQNALDAARRRHEERAEEIQAQIAALETKSSAEARRWDEEKSKLEAALRRAHG
jgi:hypothetical protein